jgi:hypothetical protein
MYNLANALHDLNRLDQAAENYKLVSGVDCKAL